MQRIDEAPDNNSPHSPPHSPYPDICMAGMDFVPGIAICFILLLDSEANVSRWTYWFQPMQQMHL